MSNAELIEWAAAFELDPWGEVREDVRHGIRCAVTANTAFGSKGGAKPSDFIPEFGKSTHRLSAAELKTRFAAYARAVKPKANKGTR